eukprot:3933480-Rhodomonas_salina.1
MPVGENTTNDTTDTGLALEVRGLKQANALLQAQLDRAELEKLRTINALNEQFRKKSDIADARISFFITYANELKQENATIKRKFTGSVTKKCNKTRR